MFNPIEKCISVVKELLKILIRKILKAKVFGIAALPKGLK